MLNAAINEALSNSDDASERRLIRKSESLATISKSLLNVQSAFITLVKVLSQAGFPLHLTVFCSLVITGVLAYSTFRLFTPIAREAQTLKSSKNDSV